MYFVNENVWISNKTSMKFVPRSLIINIPALIQIMVWRRTGDRPLSEPMIVSILTHICVTRPQWVLIWCTLMRQYYVSELGKYLFRRGLGAVRHQTYCMSSWWRHQMQTFSSLLIICTGNSPAQKPVTRSFDVFFDLHLNKRLSKQWWGWWLETPSRPLWRHSNVICPFFHLTQQSSICFVRICFHTWTMQCTWKVYL